MGRRRQESEIGFGSDSFLDIIANIVGILIILIVIAGVRVSNAPILVSDTEEQPTTEIVEQVDQSSELEESVAATDQEETPVADPQIDEPILVEITPEPVESAAPKPKVDLKELERRRQEQEQRRLLAERLQRQIEQASRDQTRKKRLVDDAQGEQDQLRKQLAVALNKLNESVDVANDRQNRLMGLNRKNEKLAAKLTGLRTELDETSQVKPKVEQLVHTLTPVSRTVLGTEIHFRLMKNRVAYVPLEELKNIVVRRKFRQRLDTAGPILGFKLEYVAVAMTLPVSSGGQTVYIPNVPDVLSGKFIATEELVTESLNEALSSSSIFYEKLITADEGTTITFWVYPDSYKTYRQLQQYAHRQGFRVAARPLPFGTEISFSRFGTRSASQ
ncbi:MAG: hypothetical protein CMJ78_02170 [Planctomycetaceae bacterium]|nr:hypothetical protein [Planctomycetaceae bacterium]